MRLLVISDIHANIEALQAVLRDADQRGFDQQVCLGDLVGFGPHPVEVIQAMRERSGLRVIKGNWDLPMPELRALVSFDDEPAGSASRNLEWFDQITQWLESKLSVGERAYLDSLDETATLTLEGLSFFAVHASPLDPMMGGLGQDMPDSPYQANAKETDAPVVLHGHTHIQHERRVDETTFVNPGSVGWPSDDDPRACYAIVEVQEGRARPSFYRVQYDQRRVYEALLAASLPNAEKILTARPFFS